MKLKHYDTTLNNTIRMLNSMEILSLDYTKADDLVHIKDIKIPPDYAATQPLDYKIRRYTRFFKAKGYLSKPIVVFVESNEKGLHNKLILIDGYVQYLIAKKYGMEFVPVKYIDINDYINKE